MSNKAQPKSSSFDASLLETGAADALSAVDKAGELAVQLVEAWIKAGNAAAVSEVAERGSGAARKTARRGLNVLKSRGIPIPERFSLTGFDRSPVRDLAARKVDTIHLSIRKLGIEAGRLLKERIIDRAAGPVRKLLQGEYVPGETV